MGSSSRLVVASRAGVLIGHSTAQDGVTAWEEDAVGSKGGTCARGRTSQHADHREQHWGGGSHTVNNSMQLLEEEHGVKQGCSRTAVHGDRPL